MTNPPIRARETPAPGFIRQLRDARVQADLSQEELGARLGWSQTRISGYEDGYKAIHPVNIARWAAALNLELTISPLTPESDPT